MKKSEEPTFPIVLQDGLSSNCHVEIGLTKREYFAGLAMQGLIAANLEVYKANGYIVPKDLALASIEFADELLIQL